MYEVIFVEPDPYRAASGLVGKAEANGATKGVFCVLGDVHGDGSAQSLEVAMASSPAEDEGISDAAIAAMPTRPDFPSHTAPYWSSIRGYEILDHLGRGDLGGVWRARDENGQDVAVRIVRPEESGNVPITALARAVVDASARIRSRHVVEYLGVAEDEEGACVIVARLIPGSEQIGRHGPVDGRSLWRIAVGLADGLAAIHHAGLTHQEIKPSNVLIDGDGEPVLIALDRSFIRQNAPQAKRGAVIGSPPFASPESIRQGTTGAPADIYGWGVTLAFAATGRPPFGSGEFVSVLARILRGEADLDGVPGWLEPIVRAALAVDPEARPTAAELIERLLAVAPQKR